MRIDHSIEINASPSHVFSWLKDPRRAAVWMTSVVRTEIITEDPRMIGTTFRERIEENGRGTEMEGVVTGYVENGEISFHLEGKYNSVDVRFQVESIGRAVRLTQTADVRFKSFLRIGALIFQPIFRKKITAQARTEFLRLKDLCESENRDPAPRI